VVTVKKSPYSYIVDFEGTQVHVHANKLRRYSTRVQQVVCSVPPLHCATTIVYEKDSDFGDIAVPETVPPDSNIVLPSHKIDPIRVAHLDTVQQEKLLSLLDEFWDCFSDAPGFCPLVEHSVTSFLNDSLHIESLFSFDN